MYSIYTLIDPRTKQTRYVGMSTDPYRRYAQHLLLTDNNAKKAEWILELRAEGLMPTLQVVEEGLPRTEALAREKAWIERYMSRREPLTNVNDAYDVPPVKIRRVDTWLSGNEAAEIISANSGHTIDANYVRQLAIKGRIKHRAKNGRENEYLRSSVEVVTVKQRRQAIEQAEKEQVLTHE
jgi:predicted GIY-YIG superfamily endonuclease